MASPPERIRYRAVSMELAAYLDARYVEMHIFTDTGASIAIVCDKDSIFAVQRHIEQMRRECPEIATWKSVQSNERSGESDRGAFAAAVSEGWPVASDGTRVPRAPARTG
jgi:hypothetical protein